MFKFSILYLRFTAGNTLHSHYLHGIMGVLHTIHIVLYIFIYFLFCVVFHIPTIDKSLSLVLILVYTVAHFLFVRLKTISSDMLYIKMLQMDSILALYIRHTYIVHGILKVNNNKKKRKMLYSLFFMCTINGKLFPLMVTTEKPLSTHPYYIIVLYLS